MVGESVQLLDDFPLCVDVRFSNRPSGVKRFQAIGTVDERRNGIALSATF
jgi:hypothetical protein